MLRQVILLIILSCSVNANGSSINNKDHKLPLALKRLVLSEDYRNLNHKLWPLVINGHAGAQYQMGLNYLNGLGLQQNNNKALTWFKKAALQQHVKAQYSTGILLINNHKNQQALKYLSLAAKQGHSLAEQRLKHLSSNKNRSYKNDDKGLLNKRLNYAIKHRDTSLARSVIEQGANINRKNSDGQTPLHIALENGYSALARLLLNNGAKSEVADALGNTSLHYAASSQSSNMMARLAKPQLIEKQNNKGETALVIAVKSGYLPSTRSLLQAGANPRVRTQDKRFLIDYTIAKQKTEISALLKKYGAVPSTNKNGDSLKSRLSLVQQQLKQSNFSSWDALMLSAWSGDKELVSFLLKKKNTFWKIKAAITLSLQKNHKKIALLISNTLQNEKDTKELNSYISISIERDCLACFRLLSKKQNTQDLNNLLWQASKYSNEAISLNLLKRGANPNVINKDGTTAMYQAVTNGNMVLVNSLLKHNANTNIKDSHGNTSLHTAINNQQHKISKTLIQAQADVNAQNKQGQSPLILAALLDDSNLVKLLLENGATAEMSSNNGNTALITAAKKAGIETVKVLLKYNSPIKHRNQNSLTALMTAVQRDKVDITQLLLETGASPSRRNKAGKSAIDMAKSESITKLLEKY